MIYPTDAIEANVEGKVSVQFFVEQNGDVSDLRIRKSLGYGCDAEALRLIREGAKWIPGTVNGDTTRQEVTIKVKFKL